MPTYEYKCNVCGYSFDAFQSIHDEPLKVCPQCGKEIRRLINGGTGVIFRGSGFYVTDTQKNSGKEAPQETAAKEPSQKKEPAQAAPASSDSAKSSDKSSPSG
ncbi:MAG: zinc ribbon domain-containing protein [Spirochaetaceae bacterium]|jgi:putative FmdB family regulatory protein|nr:zinc ribbon domain-containing protein [Spirochaetaceae bacterium]